MPKKFFDFVKITQKIKETFNKFVSPRAAQTQAAAAPQTEATKVHKPAHEHKKYNKNSNKPAIAALNPLDKWPNEADALLLAFEERQGENLTFKALTKILGTGGYKEKILLGQSLDLLEKAGKIRRIDRDNYTHALSSVLSSSPAQLAQFAEGKVEHVNASFAYVVCADLDDDIRVETQNLAGAMDGDIVKVKLLQSKRRRLEGHVIDVLHRAKTDIVGVIQMQNRLAFVIPDNRRLYHDIFITPDGLSNASHNDKVLIRITDFGSNNRNPSAHVIDVLGQSGNNDAEMHSIMAEFSLPYNFDAQTLADAAAIDEHISQEEIARRQDYRSILTFTIDPVDAKDFDDAISIRSLPNGNYEIGVHIADVSHYVRPGTHLDKEAYRRATSVYLVDRVSPMLPERLSNELCSLRPNEDKLTFSAVFEINQKAEIIQQWFGRTVIHSDTRFSYEQAQIGLETGQGPHANELIVLNNIALQLRDERFKNGSIGFETPEVRFVLDEKGTPLSVIGKVRKDAHKLVEEYMLLANKRVAEYVHNLHPTKPYNTMVYRIHEAPDTDRLRIFSAFAKRFGYKILPEGKGIANSFNQMIEDLEGKAEQNTLQQLAVRTMAKARYSTQNIGHFGLAFKYYTHFTSPIRRYPDMMCHRLLQHYLDGGAPADAAEQEAQCKHSSEMEKKASEAERASIKYKQVEYMLLQDPDKTFTGIVSGVTEWGVYVEIVETNCEGMVRMADLKDDFYELDKENFRVIGSRSRRIIAFGDTIEVKVKKANLERRSIDLEHVSEHPAMENNRGGSEGRNSRGGSEGRNNRAPREGQEQRQGERGQSKKSEPNPNPESSDSGAARSRKPEHHNRRVAKQSLPANEQTNQLDNDDENNSLQSDAPKAEKSAKRPDNRNRNRNNRNRKPKTDQQPDSGNGASESGE